MFSKAVYYGFEPVDDRHIKNALTKGESVTIDGQDLYIAYAEIDGAKFAVKIKLDVVWATKTLRYKAHSIYEIKDIELLEIKKEEPAETQRNQSLLLVWWAL